MPDIHPAITGKATATALVPLAPLDAILAIHNGPKSIVSFWKADDQGRASINLGGIAADKLPEIFPTLSTFMRDSFYFCLNSTYEQKYTRVSDLTGLKTYRRLETRLQWINAITVDLDVNHPGKPVMSFDELIAAFMGEIEESNLPPPTLISSSGRGVWPIWQLHDFLHPETPPPAFGDVRRIVKRINRAIVKRFSHLASDKLCVDTARLIRVPGSLNPTSGRAARFFRVSDQTYSLRDLADAFSVSAQKTELEPEQSEAVEEAKREKNENRVLAGKLRWQVPLMGFRQLWKMRGFFHDGTRRNALYSFSYLLRKNRVPEDRIIAECTRVAYSANPPLTDADVLQCVTESAKNFCRLPNSWFAENLKITDYEKSQLAQWFKPRKKTKKAQISERQRMIEKEVTANPKITVRALAKLLKEKHGISVGKSGIARDLKALNFVQKILLV